MFPLPLDPDILATFLVSALGQDEIRAGIEQQIADWLNANDVDEIGIWRRGEYRYFPADEIPAAIIGLFAAQFGISLPGYESPLAA